MSEPVHHSINYVELSVTDIERAKRFYGEAFGWTFTDYGPDYVGFAKGEGAEAGGFTKVDAVTAGGPLVILYSEDLEASLEAVKEAGGRVTVEPFSFPGGRRFSFSDPSGNELAVWTPA